MDTHPKESHQALHAICYYPKLTFESQRNGETVILVLRKHPITQLPWLLNVLILVFLSIVVDIFLLRYFSTGQFIVFNLFAAFFTFSYAWLNFLLWVYNVGIVTTQRVIDIDFHNILYKEFSAANNEKISDVTAQIGGYLGSLFQYGDVFVKTEGYEQNIEFMDIPQPSNVANIINELIRDSDKKP